MVIWHGPEVCLFGSFISSSVMKSTQAEPYDQEDYFCIE